MALPSEERDLVRHCSLSVEDLDRLRGVRTAHNRLGHALLLCAMRHPGRALAPGERPPVPMIAYVARIRWSLRTSTEPHEDPMTDDRMALIEALQKGRRREFASRSLAETVLQILMEADVE